jgi:hypothetical protein
MSITEGALSKNYSQESCTVTNTPTYMQVFFSRLAEGAAGEPFVIKQTPKYYGAIEVGGAVSQVSIIAIPGWSERRFYEPKTRLGKRLMALREHAIAQGLPLLDADDIVEEIHSRRRERV